MKIGILTFVNTSNYGASLQAYALQKVIQSYGHECDIIKYESKKVMEGHDPKSVFKRKGIKKLAAPLVYYVYKKRIEEFKIFENKYCTYSEKCDKNSIRLVTEKYDRIIVGSDQVWNTELTNGDKTFFLNFLDSNEKKCSYAASTGKVYFDESDKAYVECLRDFKVLSCRESETANLLKIDLSRNDISCDVDPTLLLRDQWQSFVTEPLIRSDYIFMYFIPEEREFLERIKDFARKEKCIIVLLKKGAGFRHGIKIVNIASPIDFINYVAYAKYVITGSFHALCFSLMFRKNIFISSSIVKNRSGRLMQLLHFLNLENRQAGEYGENLSSEAIDYSKVTPIIDNMCRESLRTIQKIIAE